MVLKNKQERLQENKTKKYINNTKQKDIYLHENYETSENRNLDSTDYFSLQQKKIIQYFFYFLNRNNTIFYNLQNSDYKWISIFLQKIIEYKIFSTFKILIDPNFEQFLNQRNFIEYLYLSKKEYFLLKKQVQYFFFFYNYNIFTPDKVKENIDKKKFLERIQDQIEIVEDLKYKTKTIFQFKIKNGELFYLKKKIRKEKKKNQIITLKKKDYINHILFKKKNQWKLFLLEKKNKKHAL